MPDNMAVILAAFLGERGPGKQGCSPHPFLLGQVHWKCGLVVFLSLSKEGARPGVGWRLDVGSLFSLSLLLVSIL